MFARTHDKIVRHGDFVKAFYDGVPQSESLKKLKKPNYNAEVGINLSEDDRFILRSTFAFIKDVEENRYQLGTSDPEKTIYYGVVKTINDKRRRASVVGWKVLGEILPTQQRPVVTFSLDELTKVDKSVFFERCQKPCLARLDHRTRLRAAGFDESAPLSLISYNNRIVASLMDVVDKSVSSLHQKKTGRKSQPRQAGKAIPHPPGLLKAMPAPQVAFSIDDPLAEVRTELASLSTGKKKTKSKEKGGPNVLKSHHEEMMSTGQAQRGDTSIMLNLSSGPSPHDSSTLSTQFQQTKSHLSRALNMGSSMLYVQMRAQLQQDLRVGNSFKMKVYGIDSNTGVVYVVREEIGHEQDLPLMIVFQGVRLFCPKWDPNVPSDVAPAHALRRLLTPFRGIFQGEVVGHAPGGLVIVNASVQGRSLQKMILEEGCGLLHVSALHTVDPAEGRDRGSLSPTTLSAWTDAQSRAVREKRGIWVSELALKGFLAPRPVRVDDGEDALLCVDQDCAFDGSAGEVPLFSGFESSQGFRARYRQLEATSLALSER